MAFQSAFPQRGHRVARACAGRLESTPPAGWARDPPPEPASVWGDESISLAPGMPARPAPHARHVAMPMAFGVSIGRRARRVAGSSYLHLQHASPPRVNAQRRRRCRTPLDQFTPSTHTITIPLYPQSYGFQGGTVALRHRATQRTPAAPGSVAPLPPSSPDVRGAVARGVVGNERSVVSLSDSSDGVV